MALPTSSQDPVAMELSVDLGEMPQDPLLGGAIEGGGLRGLLDKRELCDVTLVAGGQQFQAHSLVLAAASECFHQQILQEHANGTREVTLHLNVTHAEAVQDMLACIYGPFGTDAKDFFCKTEMANRDALQLAQSYQIPQLQEQVSCWLVQNLTSQNVLGRLVLCEEFGLIQAREKILEVLIADPHALPVLASHPEVTKVPKVLQDLLVRILKLLGLEASKRAEQAPSKKQSGRSAVVGSMPSQKQLNASA